MPQPSPDQFTTIVSWVTMLLSGIVAVFFGVRSNLRRTGTLKAAAEKPEPPALPATARAQAAPKNDLRELLLDTYTELRQREEQLELEREKVSDLEIKLRTWERLNLETERRHARMVERYEAKIRALEEAARTDDMAPESTTDKVPAVKPTKRKR